MQGVIHWLDGSMDSRIKRGYDEGVKFFVHPHPSLPDQCNLRSKMQGVIHWADGSMDSRIKYGYDEGVKFFVPPHPSLPDLIG